MFESTLVGVLAFFGALCLFAVLAFSVFRWSKLELNNRTLRREVRDLKEELADHLFDDPMPKVIVKSGKLQKSEPNAAGWDIFAEQDYVINPGEQVQVATGLITEMHGVDALCVGKSGLAQKFRITPRAGLIDQDYPMEWSALMTNEGREPFIVKKGTKITQCIFLKKFPLEVIADGGEVVEVQDGVRTGGFGSTGA